MVRSRSHSLPTTTTSSSFLSPPSSSSEQQHEQEGHIRLPVEDDDEEEAVVERGRRQRHRRLLDRRIRLQQQDHPHHQQNMNNPNHHRQQDTRMSRRYYHRQQQQQQPAMHVRGKKILIFPQYGGYYNHHCVRNDHNPNNIHDIWLSILQDEVSQKNRGRHNKNSSGKEENMSHHSLSSLSPPSISTSPSSSSSLEELEVSCLCLTQGLSNTIQEAILEDDRGVGMRISKLVLRSCHVVHPDALMGLLDHPQLQLNLKCLELYNLSGSLTYQCIDSIVENSHYQEQLEELTINISSRGNGNVSLSHGQHHYHENSAVTASATNDIASNRMILVHLFQRLHMLKNIKVLRLNGCKLDDSHDDDDHHHRSVTSNVFSRHPLSPILALTNHFREQSSSRDRCKRSCLRHLFLRCCQLTDQSVADLIMVMVDVPYLNIETLDLVGNKCGQKVIDVLGQTLQDDVDVDPHSSASPVKSTYRRPRRKQSLTKLDLAHQMSDLSKLDFSEMAKALRTNTTLRMLRLAGNRLNESTVSMLAKSLSHNTSIYDLDLAGVDLTNTSHRDLLHALRINQTIRYINIKYNPEIDDLSQWVTVLRSDNVGLQHLEHSIRSPISSRGREHLIQQRNELSYLLHLNRCGRKMLRMNYGSDSDRVIPLSLWPTILRRSMTKDMAAIICCDQRSDQKLARRDCQDTGYRMDAIFYFLRWGPLMTQS